MHSERAREVGRGREPDRTRTDDDRTRAASEGSAARGSAHRVLSRSRSTRRWISDVSTIATITTISMKVYAEKDEVLVERAS